MQIPMSIQLAREWDFKNHKAIKPLLDKGWTLYQAKDPANPKIILLIFKKEGEDQTFVRGYLEYERYEIPMDLPTFELPTEEKTDER